VSVVDTRAQAKILAVVKAARSVTSTTRARAMPRPFPLAPPVMHATLSHCTVQDTNVLNREALEPKAVTH